eukprot:462845-Pyramimonas_sp.AAC.1
MRTLWPPARTTAPARYSPRKCTGKSPTEIQLLSIYAHRYLWPAASFLSPRQPAPTPLLCCGVYLLSRAPRVYAAPLRNKAQVARAGVQVLHGAALAAHEDAAADEADAERQCTTRLPGRTFQLRCPAQVRTLKTLKPKTLRP